MGVIVDANVASEVFVPGRTEAGDRFREWLNAGGGRLSSGGKNLVELRKVNAFRQWEKSATRYQRIRYEDSRAVNQLTDKLTKNDDCESDDQHVIALANEGCGRLLYSNDGLLQRDFRNPDIVNHPRGAVYTTRRGGQLTDVHRQLMERTDLCASGSCYNSPAR